MGETPPGGPSLLQHVLHPLHPDGWKFVCIAAVVTLLLFLLWQPLGWIALILTLWIVYFFRDPPRVTPLRAGLIVSPADGLVVSIAEAVPPHDLAMGEEPMTRIGIFLNIFDVHINRMPADGVVVDTRYRRGTFVNASLDKASEDNERMAIRLKTVDGPEIAVVQIAGLIARRIVCHVQPGSAVTAGQRFGLIRFGSRTDLYLPRSWSILAVEGQRVLGGETVLADSTSTEPRRMGAVR
ncbi:MAG TPA: phosphatidylserine decarboxylase [Stellaceae bacterium]|nr:phosphatidylserine decarboxylase [Stellaceae bacterium]